MCQGPDNAMIKAVARAFRWREMLEKGTHATITDLAQAERIDHSYVGAHSSVDAAGSGYHRGHCCWIAARSVEIGRFDASVLDGLAESNARRLSDTCLLCSRFRQLFTCG
jgi:hypothetical protein